MQRAPGGILHHYHQALVSHKVVIVSHYVGVLQQLQDLYLRREGKNL